MRQETKWGYIDWEYLPNKNNTKRWFSIGTVTILPGCRMSPHIHYSNEQFLYVIEGSANYKLNGIMYNVKPGDYFCLESDTTHEAYNPGPGVYREIMVTNPMPNEADAFRGLTRARRRNSIEPQVDEDNQRKLHIAVEQLGNDIFSDISIPYCLFDTDGNIITNNEQFPKNCFITCDPIHTPKDCPCFTCSLADGQIDEERNAVDYICPHGMLVYLYPILRNDRIAGILRGGHHFSSRKTTINHVESHQNLYDTPYSTEFSIHHTMRRIVNMLLSYCDMLDSIEGIESQEQLLADSTQRNDELMKNLSIITEKVTNMNINHHFLFNTLNCIANAALTEERAVLYESIVDLSKMFRYTTAQGSQIVPLSQEIDYLRSYLNLQKMRYRDDLTVIYDIDTDCVNTRVPFNFLQPIVENAFTHSFASLTGKKTIKIQGKLCGNQVVIISENNGIPPKKEDLKKIMQDLSSCSGHGLSFVYDKLRLCFGNEFQMNIELNANQHTCVTVRIPKE